MSYKILIVEDDINFRYAIREIVPWGENGFEIAGEAIHGIQALQILEKRKIDIVLTDMSMPLMNGIELTREISRKYPDILVVAFSAYDDFSFVKEAMKNGAKDYILKQELDPDEVIATLKNICKEKEQKYKKEDIRERLRYYTMKWLATGIVPDEQVQTYISGLLGERRVVLLKIMAPRKEEVDFILDKGKEKILFRKHDEEGNLYLIWQLLETSSMRQQLEEQHRIVNEIQYAGYTPIGAAYADTWCLMADFQADSDTSVLPNDPNAIKDVESRTVKFADSDAWRGVLERLQERQQYTNKDVFGTDWDSVCTDIANGDTAMTLNGSWAESNIRAMNSDANIGVFALPVSNDSASNLLPIQGGNEGIAYNPEGKNADIAKEFIDAYTTAESGQKYMDETGNISIKKGISTDGVTGGLGDIVDIMNNGGSVSLGSTDHNFTSEYRDAVQTVVSDFLLSEKSVDEALSDLDSEFDRIANS